MRATSELLLFAQQNTNAYQTGRMVGQITAYVLVAAVVLWIIGKVVRKR